MDDLRKSKILENKYEEEDLNSETDLSSSDDESVIETIEQHKKLVNGKLRYKNQMQQQRKQAMGSGGSFEEGRARNGQKIQN